MAQAPVVRTDGSAGAILPACFRRILVAVDFSESSRAAVVSAAELADLFGGCLELLHVWQPPLLSPDLMVWAENDGMPLRKLAQTQAERELDSFIETFPEALSATLSPIVAEGDPSRVILELAASGRYDLVAIGTHGRTGLEHPVVGSIAEKIVRAATCPVLTVRSVLRTRKFRRS